MFNLTSSSRTAGQTTSGLARTDLLPPTQRRLIVLSQRAPLAYHQSRSGEVTSQHSTSGLVAASEPLLSACHGTWVAHGESAADWANGGTWEAVPPSDPRYLLRRVWAHAADWEAYCDRFCNEGLWPWCHQTSVAPRFADADFEAYSSMNARFVDAAVEEAQHDGAMFLVQDYHLALAPALLRERMPSSSIVAFWHVPWPSFDRVGLCPVAPYLIEGLLGSHLVGFQTRRHCQRFLDAAERLLGASIDRTRGLVTHNGRRTYVRCYPASIDLDAPALAGVPPSSECGALVRRRLGIAPGCRLIVGVDRLDYTKGLVEKLLAFKGLLEREPEHAGRVAFVQAAQPTREAVPAYREYRRKVVSTAARINSQFGTRHWQPVHLLDVAHTHGEVYELLRAADVCYVGSLDDGMNLVAKEYVNAREDERGVLVLSAFAGAMHELTHAVVITPNDPDASARMLDEALRMSPDEQRHRMRAMRHRVFDWDASRWGAELLGDLERVRGDSARAAASLRLLQ